MQGVGFQQQDIKKKSQVQLQLGLNKAYSQKSQHNEQSRGTTVAETQFAVSAPSQPSFFSGQMNQNMNWPNFQIQTLEEANQHQMHHVSFQGIGNSEQEQICSQTEKSNLVGSSNNQFFKMSHPMVEQAPQGLKIAGSIYVEDILSIKMSGKDHPVDTIVQFKRTKTGKPLFRLSMCCHCCKSKSFWISKSQIEENGTRSLNDLAKQVQEMYEDGIDIQSQKTNEQLDYEEELEEIGNFLNEWQQPEIPVDNQKVLQAQFQPLPKQVVPSQLILSGKKKISFDGLDMNKFRANNDSIASNKSQVSMHDNYQNCLNDSITNAQFDFSVEGDDEENSQMMCCDIIANPKNDTHEISAQIYEEHNQIIQNDELPRGRNRYRLKSQNSNFSYENNCDVNEPQIINKSFSVINNGQKFNIQSPINEEEQRSSHRSLFTTNGRLQNKKRKFNQFHGQQEEQFSNHFRRQLKIENRPGHNLSVQEHNQWINLNYRDTSDELVRDNKF